jgi:hypothetical protein
MRFQIRNPDAESYEEFKASEAAYSKHLEPFKKTSNSHLWKYFAQDFFHDGSIKSIGFTPDLHSVVLELDCPNIRALKENGEFEYVNIGFTCTFQNVIRFSLEDPNPAEWSDQLGSCSNYLYSEINTALPDHLAGEPCFYSLIIECISGSASRWIEVVFSQVDVEPHEPAAFALMVASPQFEVPGFSVHA